MYMCIYIYIFIYIYKLIILIIIIIIIITTPNLPTNIVDFRGFDSSTILILRGGNSHIHRI